jgi:hypothetical protein
MDFSNHRQMSLICAAACIVSIFLPWLEGSASASFGGYSSSYSSGGISGIQFGGGILALIIAAVGGYFVYENKPNPHYFGAINVVIGIGHAMGWFGSLPGMNVSANYGGVSASASLNPQYGLYLLIIGAAAFTYFSFQLSKSKGEVVVEEETEELNSETNQSE